MNIRKSAFIFLFFITPFLLKSQENDCKKFLQYFEKNDFHNTIKSILECKNNNDISETEETIFNYFLNVSYFILGNLEEFRANKLEDSMNSGLLGNLYILLGRSILSSYYSQQSNTLKKTENHIRLLLQASSTFSSIGNYEKAIEVAEEALIKADQLHEKSRYIDILNQISYCYFMLGDYEKAKVYAEELIKLATNSYIEENPGKLSFLAVCYSYLGDNDKAITLCEQILSVIKITDGVSLGTLNNLSICYAKAGNIMKAIELGEIAVKNTSPALGEYQPEFRNMILNLSIFYSEINNYEQALNFGIRAFNIIKDMENRYSDLYLNALLSLSFMYLMTNDFHESYVFINQYFYNIVNNTLKKQFLWLSEDKRYLFWETRKNTLVQLPNFHYLSNGYNKFVDVVYNSVIFSKGLLLQSSIELYKLLMESGNDEVVEKVNELRAIHHTLNRLYEKPISERYLSTDSLETVAQKLERELLASSKEFGDYTRFMDITWQDVQKNLDASDVAIEFVEFPVLKSDSVMYAALVLRKDWEHPQMISLFEKKQIEQYLQQSPDKTYSGYVGKQLYNLMWQPLEEIIAPGEDIYFSAVGAYHQLALEHLPAEDGIPLYDKYNLHRVSSTRQLALSPEKQPYHEAALYGGIQYDVNPTEMLSESKKYQPDESLYAYRGMSMDSLRGSQWVSLANTVPEVDFISDELNRNNIQATVYTGTSANEESFKALSGKKINMLHLATHGFFLPIEETRKINYFQMLGRENNPAPDLSMRRSGLIMAGGNRAWSGDSIPQGVDDGILTAQEISVLDFRGMDLVALSACETGLGDINTSEGVFGLQRAFKKAGVNTIVMSLWKVNDEVTKALMNKFYQNLLQGKSKRDSFQDARSFIRARHPEPRNWAAFIMLD